jgi:5-formyltetrahydrofolate cyclo-ligase
VDDKDRLRQDALRRRSAMSSAERAAAGEALASVLGDVLAGADRVACYAAVGTEPPTGPLFAVCREVLLPVLLPHGDLDWALHRDDLQPARKGLLEPAGPRLGVDAISTCDVVLVPALAVDRNGNRLGRGGGSYDRALPRVTGLTIALLYDGEQAETLPGEPHDVAVRAVATPSYGLLLLPSATT